MNDTKSGGIVLAVISLAIVAFIGWRVAAGSSYISQTAMRVSRSNDLFSFWLSFLFPAICAVLAAIGSFDLLPSN